jgi:hypothetical protein
MRSFLILITIVLFNSISFADEICNDDRKIWIKQLKKDMERDFVNPVFSDKECVAELIEHNGISMEQHLYRLAATKRDDFKNTSTREVSYFLRNLFDDINASNKN